MEVTRRNEGRIGKHYERYVFALISLKCLLNSEIKDFWISTNLQLIKKFDDVVLHVQYQDDTKEVFLVQIKHKEKSDKPVVAEMFCKSQKDFALQMYQEAYFEIIENKNVLELLEVHDSKFIKFIILSDCKIELNQKNEKVAFKNMDFANFREFLSCEKYDVSPGYQIINKSENYDPQFLSNLYFYPEQCKTDGIEGHIKKLLEVDSIIIEIIQFFYQYTESTENCNKLFKLYIKIKVLSRIFGHFNVPNVEPTDSLIIKTIKPFNLTFISDNISEKKICSDILFHIQKFYDEKELKFLNWEKPLLKEIQIRIKERYPLLLNENLSVKNLYLFMVALSHAPFYKIINRGSSDINVFRLLTNLKVFSVINHTDTCLQEILQDIPNNIKIFRTMADLDEKTFKESAKFIYISNRNKPKITLEFLKIKKDVRQKINSNLFVQIMKSNILIAHEKENNKKIYVERTLKRLILKPESLQNLLSQTQLIIICNVPIIAQSRILKYFGEEFNCISSDNFLYCTTEMSKDLCPVWITNDQYSNDILKKITKLKKNEYSFYILQLEAFPDKVIFTLLNTNGSVEKLRKYFNTVTIPDHELIRTFKLSRVNIICNIAGMGKTTLLRHLLHRFPKEDCVIYIQLNKYIDALNKIENFNEFVVFLNDSGLIQAKNSTFPNFFNTFYECYAEAGKLVLLLDDIEEITNKTLLQIFKEATQKGWKLWIVVRQSVKEEYENYFGSFSFELIELSANQQQQFFKNFLQIQNCDKIIMKTKIESFNIITKGLENTFIGNCQLIMMLAEILLLEDNLKDIQTHKLYEDFINLNLQKYYSKNYNFILRTLSKLALTAFFEKSLLSKIFDLSEYECDLEVLRHENSKHPFIEFTNKGIAVFSHKTYAEFLAAKWLADNARKQMLKETPFNIKELIKHLYCCEMINVRRFFDQIILTMETKNYVIDFSFGQVKYNADVLGRNIFHYLMTYGNLFNLNTTSKLKYIIQNNEDHTHLKVLKNKIILEVPEIINDNNTYQFDLMFNNKIMIINARFQLMKSDNNKYTIRSEDGAIVRKGEKPEHVSFNSLDEMKHFIIFCPDFYINLDPLRCALLAGCCNKVEKVMSYGSIFNTANFSNMDKERYFLLYHSVKNGFINILRKLLLIDSLKKEVVKVRDGPTKMSLLHLAVKFRRESCIKELLQLHPPHAFGQDENGNTPLHLACDWTNVNILNLFLSSNELNFLNFKNKMDQSLLYCYTQYQNLDCIKILLKYIKRSSIDYSDNENKNSPFILSIIKRNLKIAELLYKGGADINVVNEKGMNALHLSVLLGNFKCTKQLIKWNVDINCQNKIGFTPLIIAARKGNYKIFQLLLINDASINISDNNGWTALHHAVKTENFKVAEILLAKKAEVNCVNHKGNTPLVTACTKNLPKVVELLLKHDADTDHFSVSEKGTPISICKKNKYFHCIKVIDLHLAKIKQETFKTHPEYRSNLKSKRKK